MTLFLDFKVFGGEKGRRRRQAGAAGFLGESAGAGLDGGSKLLHGSFDFLTLETFVAVVRRSLKMIIGFVGERIMNECRSWNAYKEASHFSEK